MDGKLCYTSTDPLKWNCCKNKGGRKRCPPNYPEMCLSKRCYNDHCCNVTGDCEKIGDRQRPCSVDSEKCDPDYESHRPCVRCDPSKKCDKSKEVCESETCDGRWYNKEDDKIVSGEKCWFRTDGIDIHKYNKKCLEPSTEWRKDFVDPQSHKSEQKCLSRKEEEDKYCGYNSEWCYSKSSDGCNQNLQLRGDESFDYTFIGIGNCQDVNGLQPRKVWKIVESEDECVKFVKRYQIVMDTNIYPEDIVTYIRNLFGQRTIRYHPILDWNHVMVPILTLVLLLWVEFLQKFHVVGVNLVINHIETMAYV